MNTVTLNLAPIIHLTDDQLYQVCTDNKDLNLELTATGKLIILPGSGGEKGIQEANLNASACR